MADAVSPQHGLKSLTVTNYIDINQVDQWPLTQLSNKAFACEELVFDNFEGVTVPVEVRGAWLELAGRVCEGSECLGELNLSNSATTAE